MDKKEFVLSFIDVIRKGEEDKIYKYFTSRTEIFYVKEKKNSSLDEFIKFLKDNLLNKDINISRIFESSVCIKVEINNDFFPYEALYFVIESRRFKRIEIM